MSTKFVNKIKIPKNVINSKTINCINTELLECEKIIAEELKITPYIFIENKPVFYDSHVAGIFPMFDQIKYYADSKDNNLYDIELNMKKLLPNGFNWKLISSQELKNTVFSINFPYKNKTKSLQLKGSSCFYILAKNENMIHLYNLETNSRTLAFKTGMPFPIARLGEVNNDAVDARTTLVHLINNGLIPKINNLPKNYKTFIEKAKKCKLNPETLTFAPNNSNKDVFKNKNQLTLNDTSIKDFLLKCDKFRADIKEYNVKILENPNSGHWELWDNNLENATEFTLKEQLVARDPESSIIDGVVGIDFGTKSTVVVYQDDSIHSLPMRIGTGDISKAVDKSHYENPTIIEFNDCTSFLNAYQSCPGRPYTKWNDVTVSHTAYNSLMEGSSSSDFNSFFTELKQWAGEKGRKVKIVDKNNKIIDLPTYLELKDEMDPIEIYAYYLGLYINNMHNGIYMNYYLSFPVTYEVPVREKLLQSFKKGLKKSLPIALVENETAMEQFSVEAGASEPAAYAITALQCYGFDPMDDEKICYGVFDFGGGTTDFDFGIWRDANKADEKRYDYVIEHFGAGGDPYLGGENILQLIAFEVFKHNAEQLRENEITFTKPHECNKFIGSEILISDSREAHKNMKELVEKLREFWENDAKLTENNQTSDIEMVSEDEQEDNVEEITIDLIQSNGEKKTGVKLECDYNALRIIIENRIKRGVINFFEKLRAVINKERTQVHNIENINIFLAGNASKSIIVKDLFNKYIKLQNSSDDTDNNASPAITLTLFPPLGTEESYQKMEELGITPDKDDLKAPTGKTGVAFGLIDSRRGSPIKIIDHNVKEDIPFKYYLGFNRKRKFKCVCDKDEFNSSWIELIDASVNTFEIYYTSQAIITTGKVPITDKGIKLKRLTLDSVDENANVFIRRNTATAFDYVVANTDDLQDEKYITKIKTIELG